MAKHATMTGRAELFKSYGDSWFTSTSRTEKIGFIPTTDDYVDAEEMLERLFHLTSHQSKELQADLYNMTIFVRDTFLTSRILNAFPDTLDRAHLAMNASMSAASQPDHIQTRTWLEENGRCVDHIAPGISNIPGAGRGAFAKRKLHKGQVVTASPMIHSPQTKHNVTAMYDIRWNDPRQVYVRHLDKIESYQVGLNYCFGHAESTMLLCPYGYGISLINHGKAQQGRGHDDKNNKNNNANLRIRWAQDFFGHHHDLVENSTLEDLEHRPGTFFVFEYVALRDIDKGEELLIDYGKEWEQAWHLHKEKWLQSNSLEEKKKSSYISSSHMSEQLKRHDDIIIRTQMEQITDPYPSNLEIRCHSHVIFMNPKLSSSKTNNFVWKRNTHGHPCRILGRYWNRPEGGGNSSSQDDDDEDDDDGVWLYVVDVEVWPPNHYYYSDEDDDLDLSVTRMIQSRVPRRALRFFDKPGTTDLHLPSAFRHWIGVPNEIFPDQWRNRRRRKQE